MPEFKTARRTGFPAGLALSYLLSSGLYRRLWNCTISAFCSQTILPVRNYTLPRRLYFFVDYLLLKFIRWISREICDYTMRIFKIEYLKNRIICCLVLSLNDWIIHASFLYTLVVLKYCFTMNTNPCIFWRRNRNL